MKHSNDFCAVQRWQWFYMLSYNFQSIAYTKNRKTYWNSRTTVVTDVRGTYMKLFLWCTPYQKVEEESSWNLTARNYLLLWNLIKILFACCTFLTNKYDSTKIKKISNLEQHVHSIGIGMWFLYDHEFWNFIS